MHVKRRHARDEMERRMCRCQQLSISHVCGFATEWRYRCQLLSGLSPIFFRPPTCMSQKMSFPSRYRALTIFPWSSLFMPNT